MKIEACTITNCSLKKRNNMQNIVKVLADNKQEKIEREKLLDLLKRDYDRIRKSWSDDEWKRRNNCVLHPSTFFSFLLSTQRHLLLILPEIQLQ